MRIGIDARFYGSAGKGLGRYTQKLIIHLEKIDRENEYFVLLRQENFDQYQPQNSNFHKVLANYPWYSWQEQIFLPFQLARLKLDMVHFPHFNIPLFYFGKFVVTIHDLTHGQSTSAASTRRSLPFYFKKLIYSLVIKSALKRAQKIITVSEFVKQSIIKEYKIRPDKITVTYESA